MSAKWIKYGTLCFFQDLNSVQFNSVCTTKLYIAREFCFWNFCVLSDNFFNGGQHSLAWRMVQELSEAEQWCQDIRNAWLAQNDSCHTIFYFKNSKWNGTSRQIWTIVLDNLFNHFSIIHNLYIRSIGINKFLSV